MAPRATLVIFAGGFGTTPAERLVDQARLASAFDAIEAFSGQVIVVTDDTTLAVEPDNVTIDADPGEFHFGRRLVGVIRRHSLEHFVYMGAGSVPLFTSADLAGVAASVTAGVAVTNNLYSSDIVAFPVVGKTLEVIESLERDNALARALHEQAAIHIEELPRTLATQFDIDSPADVATLALISEGFSMSLRGVTKREIGPHLRDHLESSDLDLDRYRAVLPYFLDTTKQILVAGRVGSHAWQYLERETACRVRIFAEERGMEADGRAESGAARSLLGLYLDEVGPERFFAALPGLCDAAFIDTRVLLAHKRIEASRSDRFLSDLGRHDEIADQFLREFTRAAVGASIPVLLGGHSLMSGDLMALNEHAWSLRDEGKL